MATVKINRYAEMSRRHQKDFDELPLGFAFSEQQFNEQMEEWGLNPVEDMDKITGIYGGQGFIQKKDFRRYAEVCQKINEDLDKAIAEDEDGSGFIREMFAYELANHEYGYTHDIYETLDSLGYTEEDLALYPALMHGLELALADYRIID